MNKSIRELEKQRRDKISGLNIDEVKSYILKLNKDRFNSFVNHDKGLVDFYTDKIREIFDITEGIYVNLDNVSDNCEIDILYSNLIVNNNNEIASRLLYQCHLLLQGEIQLHKDLKLYKLLKDKDLGEAIDLLEKSMFLTILSMQLNLDYEREAELSIVSDNIKEDKNLCLKLYKEGDRRHRLMVDYGYIEALDGISEAIRTYDRQCNSFITIQKEVLNLVFGVDEINDLDFNEMVI